MGVLPADQQAVDGVQVHRVHQVTRLKDDGNNHKYKIIIIVYCKLILIVIVPPTAQGHLGALIKKKIKKLFKQKTKKTK